MASRDAMHTLFDAAGHHSRRYASAEEFLAHVTLEEPSCLVTDLRMPGMSGLELYRHVREAWPGMATIIVTAYDDEDAEGQAMREGADGFLHKPVDSDTLIQSVQDALANHESVQQDH